MLHHLQAVAVHAYYCGLHNAGRAACERIISIPDVPPEAEQLARSNRTWYAKPLADLVTHSRAVQLGTDITTRPGWSWFNPSVFAWPASPTAWCVALRQSNYLIDDDGSYQMANGDTCVRTETTLAFYNDDWQLVDQWELPINYEHNGHRIVGLEDVRINKIGGKLVASGSVLDYGDHTGLARIGTVEIDTDTRTCGPLVVRETPGRVGHEKNWMPVAYGDLFIYHCHVAGGVEMAIPEGDNRWMITRRGTSPSLARGFRGGGQVVSIGDTWLGIVHEVADAGGDRAGRRVYEHRFVEFDEGWNLARVSQPFALQQPRQIEFAAGFARRGDTLAISFGVRDASAWVLEVPLADVQGLMREVA